MHKNWSVRATCHLRSVRNSNHSCAWPDLKTFKRFNKGERLRWWLWRRRWLCPDFFVRPKLAPPTWVLVDLEDNAAQSIYPVRQSYGGLHGRWTGHRALSERAFTGTGDYHRLTLALNKEIRFLRLSSSAEVAYTMGAKRHQFHADHAKPSCGTGMVTQYFDGPTRMRAMDRSLKAHASAT